jgi:hypothetical protein
MEEDTQRMKWPIQVTGRKARGWASLLSPGFSKGDLAALGDCLPHRELCPEIKEAPWK